jgi:hypothetical protein
MGLPRIYEYKAEDGTTYWTFKLIQGKITPPTRLEVQSRLGIHLINFLVWLRAEGRRRSEGNIPE